ncbi:MAG: DUF2516 family protein [Corynebacteriales bacterium]|nr:DUF2516 family protein [Mycobacteriales bacterium]
MGLMNSSGLWVDGITGTIALVIFLVSLVLEVWAFIHCAIQRSDAFTALGTLSKGIWLLLIGGMMLLSYFFFILNSLFGLIALIAALVYLLDLRPRIKDLLNGNH